MIPSTTRFLECHQSSIATLNAEDTHQTELDFAVRLGLAEKFCPRGGFEQ